MGSFASEYLPVAVVAGAVIAVGSLFGVVALKIVNRLDDAIKAAARAQVAAQYEKPKLDIT